MTNVVSAFEGMIRLKFFGEVFSVHSQSSLYLG